MRWKGFSKSFAHHALDTRDWTHISKQTRQQKTRTQLQCSDSECHWESWENFQESLLFRPIFRWLKNGEESQKEGQKNLQGDLILLFVDFPNGVLSLARANTLPSLLAFCGDFHHQGFIQLRLQQNKSNKWCFESRNDERFRVGPQALEQQAQQPAQRVEQRVPACEGRL